MGVRAMAHEIAEVLSHSGHVSFHSHNPPYEPFITITVGALQVIYAPWFKGDSLVDVWDKAYKSWKDSNAKDGTVPDSYSG